MADYSKLNSIDWLQQVPRTLTPEIETICNEIHGKPFWFVFWGGGKKGWVRNMENARLSFVYVVQANLCLYQADEAQSAPAVFLATTHEQAADPAWMEQRGGELDLRFQENEFPEVAAYLAAEDSDFDIQLPLAQTNGIPFRIYTTYVNPDDLPGGYIPRSKVLPALLHGKEWSLLPPKLYY